jgi:folate-binding protein YgfZ
MTTATHTAAAMRTHVGYACLDNDFAWLEIAGADTVAFLQNRTTQDLKALEPGQGAFAAVLDKGAHLQGFGSFHRWEDRFYLLVEREQLASLIPALEKYRIIEQVTFQVVENVTLLAVQGPEAAQLLPLPTHPLGIVSYDGGFLVRRSLTGENGAVLVLPENTDWPQSQPAVPMVSPANLNVLRVEAGLPRFGLDMDTGTLLPETGLEVMAVSYSKGCYLGQETVARVKTYGAVQKLLMGLQLPAGSPLPEPGSPVVLTDGPTVGTFKSAAQSVMLEQPIAMAYLDKTHRTPGQVLPVLINGLPVDATVTPLPFYAAGAQQALTLLDAGLRQFASAKDAKSETAAADTLRQAITLDPTLADGYEALGVLLSRQGQYEEAVALMQRLLEVDPNRVMAHTNLSIYYLKLGDKEKAEEEKAKATLLSMKLKAKASGLMPPTDPDAERRKREAALRDRIRLFENALAVSPEDPLGNFGLGGAYMELGEYAQAVPCFEKTLAAQPTHSVAYLSLGKCYEALADWPNARKTYENGIEVAARRGDRMPLTEMQQRLQHCL